MELFLYKYSIVLKSLLKKMPLLASFTSLVVYINVCICVCVCVCLINPEISLCHDEEPLVSHGTSLTNHHHHNLHTHTYKRKEPLSCHVFLVFHLLLLLLSVCIVYKKFLHKNLFSSTKKVPALEYC